MGYTNSSDFPTTSGAYDTSFNGSGSTYYDGGVFVVKLDSSLTSLQASTHLGGSDGWNFGYAISLDTSGNVYVTGFTYSSDFPVTSGAYDTSADSSSLTSDGFIAKLDSSLASLQASTYLGGSNSDTGRSIALDTGGNVYVMGYTNSSDFPTTSGAYDTSHNSSSDVFVCKLDSSLSSLEASTYLGGSDSDSGMAIALDTGGNVYVTGRTYSRDFPTTFGAYDTSINNYDSDAFVAKLDSSLTSLQASTYLGGSDNDYGMAIALDTGSNVYVAGSTESSDFPVTSGAYDTSFNGSDDVFVAKLDSSLTIPQSSTTHLGGLSDDCVWAIALDTGGNVYMTGYTGSRNFPVTSGVFDTSFNNDNSYKDIFVAKLDSDLSSVPGMIYGVVYDKKGDPVPEVRVTTKISESLYGGLFEYTTEETVYTDSEGYFEFTDVKQGKYKVSTKKKEYKKAKTKITLDSGEEEYIEFELKSKK